MKLFRENWIEWLAGLVLAAILIATIAGFTPANDLFCQAGESCLREWISATSGWGAAFAALFTVIFIQRQIDQTNRQHRQQVAIQLQPTFTLVRRVHSKLFSLFLLAGEAGKGMHPDTTSEAERGSKIIVALCKYLPMIRDDLEAPQLTEFEEKIGTPSPGDLELLRRTARLLAKEIPALVAEEAKLPFVNMNIEIAWRFLNDVQKYARMCDRVGRQFLDEWDERGSPLPPIGWFPPREEKSE